MSPTKARFVLSTLLLMPLVGTVARSDAPRISFAFHNLMPDFWKFWAQARNKPADRQLELWRQVYLAPNQTVFDDLNAPCEHRFNANTMRTDYFPYLPALVPEMHAVADRVDEEMTIADRHFLHTFPDMHWVGDVYIMASGGCFNGRAQMIAGRSAILLGIDDLAALGQKNLVPLLEHELFHRYHHQFFDFEPTGGYPLWTSLWAEGMATFVAEQLNPDATQVDLGLMPKGMPKKVDGQRKLLASAFLKSFEATDSHDALVWFNDDNSKDPMVPARAGYELGVLTVRELFTHHSKIEMAHWSRAEAEPHVHAALEALAK